MSSPKPPNLRRIPLIPIFLLAWLLDGLSEWSYDAAAWLYEKLGTDILTANITWEKNDE
jgi:hypothetical protein